MKNSHNEFVRHGHVVISNFFTEEEISILKTSAAEMVEAQEAPGKWMKYFEGRESDGRRILNRVEYFLDYWKTLYYLLNSKKIYEFINELLEAECILFKEKLNTKMPGAGGYAPHQDGAAWKMLKNEAVTLMIPVDTVTSSNGPLELDSNFKSGRKFLPHINGMLESQTTESIEWKKIFLNIGDMVAFSSYLAHKSDGNSSTTSRRCYFITYNNVIDGSLRQDYFKFKRGSFPPEIERDSNKSYAAWKGKLARKLV